MDHVDSFSDCKNAQFAFFKPFTCAMQNEHSTFRKCNSKMVLFCMHKSIVGLAIIKLATPQACKQCRVASHSARLLRSNVGRMQTILPKCNSQIALHARRTVGPCHKTWGEQVGETTTACHILLHLQTHTYICIHAYIFYCKSKCSYLH